MTPIAPHITAYLRERLPNERKASPHTCDAYAYTFQLLFQFASQRLGCSPSAIQLQQLDVSLVLAFLEHLQVQRHNGPST
jgi:integrase/recombinase XerD